MNSRGHFVPICFLALLLTLQIFAPMAQGEKYSERIDAVPYSIDFPELNVYDQSNLSQFSIYQDEEFHGYLNGSTYLVNSSIWLEDQTMFPVSNDVLVFRNATTISTYEDGVLTPLMETPINATSLRIQRHNGTYMALWSDSGWSESFAGLNMYSEQSGFSSFKPSILNKMGDALLFNNSIYATYLIMDEDNKNYSVHLGKFSLDGALEFELYLGEMNPQGPVSISIFEFEESVVISNYGASNYGAITVSESGEIVSLKEEKTQSITGRSDSLTAPIIGTLQCEDLFIDVYGYMLAQADYISYNPLRFYVNHFSVNSKTWDSFQMPNWMHWFDPHSCSGLGFDYEGNVFRVKFEITELSPELSEFNSSNATLGIEYANMFFENKMIEFNCQSEIDLLVYDHQEIMSIDVESEGGLDLVNYSINEVGDAGEYLLYTTFEFGDNELNTIDVLERIVELMNQSTIELNITFTDIYFGENYSSFVIDLDCISAEQNIRFGIAEFTENITQSNLSCFGTSCFISSFPTTETIDGKVTPTNFLTTGTDNAAIEFLNDCGELEVRNSTITYFIDRVEVSYNCIVEPEEPEEVDNSNNSSNNTENNSNETVNPVVQIEENEENTTIDGPNQSEEVIERTFLKLITIGLGLLMLVVLITLSVKKRSDSY